MPEHAAIIDVSRYYPAPGKRQELLDAMRTLASSASSSQGCFGAQACESDQDAETLVADGRTNREIGEELHLAEKTVKNYVSSILSKLEVARRAEAAAYLARHTTTPGT